MSATSLVTLRRWGSLYLALAALFASLLLLTPTTYAAQAPPGGEGGGSAQTPDPGSSTDICAGGENCNKFVDKYINPIILLLSGLVGVVAVISIILAGIQYSASADDPQIVTKAKQRIFNTVIGLVAYIFLFALLNYLIPGGLL